MNGKAYSDKFVKTSCIPIETKKIVTKKSLNDKSLLSISILNGEFANKTPAMNEPITIDKLGMPNKGTNASKANKKQIPFILVHPMHSFLKSFSLKSLRWPRSLI